MTETAVFTCCSLNHIAMAIALGESVREFHPGVRFVIGLVDRLPPGGLPGAAAGFDVVEVDRQVAPDLDEMAALYRVGTLNCALKTAFARHLFAAHGELQKLVYLDSDIRLYAPLANVFALLDRTPIVFSPHRLQPSGGAGAVAEETFLRTGSYNAGFFALARSAEAARYLEWMTERMRAEGLIDPLRGLFMDQKWLDLAVALFHPYVGLLTDAGCNVGYWNLDERILQRSGDGRWRVNATTPLVFFHFSGYTPAQPGHLSVYSDLALDDLGEPLATLVRDYAARLDALEHARWLRVPCHYDGVRRRSRRETLRQLGPGAWLRHHFRRACRWAGWRLLQLDKRCGAPFP